MNEVSTLSVFTATHIPQSVRPLLAQVLANEFQHAYADGLWGFVRLFMFAKSVLRTPPRGGRRKRHVIKSLFLSRLQRWQQGHLVDLWEETRRDVISLESCCDSTSVRKSNIRRALRLAQEGRYGDATRSLASQGCTPHSSRDALLDLLQRHPQRDLPTFAEDLPPPLAVHSNAVLTALKAFPRGTSPGASQLRHQHLLT